jgi:hypothetical protein
MYERSNPFYEYFAGVLDMTNCKYEQFDKNHPDYRTSLHPHSGKTKVKLEGSGKSVSDTLASWVSETLIPSGISTR